MNLEQMKESRALRIKRETQSEELQRRKLAREKIEENSLVASCPLSEEERLSREIDALMSEVA